MTATELITAAAGKIAVRNLTAADSATALVTLNAFLTAEGVSGMYYVDTRESFTLTESDYDYTIGPSGGFVTERPERILHCVLRDADSYDTTLEIIDIQEYQNITNKAWVGKPSRVCLEQGLTNATILFDCAPDYAYTAEFLFQKTFATVSAGDTISAPGEFIAYLIYNLAIHLATDWDRAPSAAVATLAKEYSDRIQRHIAARRLPRKATFDALGSGGEERFADIATDDVYVDGGSF